MKSWFVVNESLRALPDALELEIRLPWYRSLPLSALDFGPVVVDGVPADLETVTLRLNEQQRPLTNIPKHWQEYWWVLDSAYLHIPFLGAEPGREYELDITLVIHPPYVPNVFFPAVYRGRMRAR